MLTRCESNSGKNAQLTLLYEEARAKRKYDFNTGDFDTGEGGGKFSIQEFQRARKAAESNGFCRIIAAVYHRSTRGSRYR